MRKFKQEGKHPCGFSDVSLGLRSYRWVFLGGSQGGLFVFPLLTYIPRLSLGTQCLLNSDLSEQSDSDHQIKTENEGMADESTV